MEEEPGEPLFLDETGRRPRSSRGKRPAGGNRKAWLILLLLVPFGVVFMVGLLAAVVLFWDVGTKEAPISPDERALLLDAALLAEWMGGFEPDPAFESAKKSVYLDGSFDLDYEYDDPDEDAPYIDFSITFEKKTSDAVAGYIGMRPAMSIGLEAMAEEDTDVVERNDLFSWGDQCYFAIVKVDGKPSGHMLAARRGKVLVSMILFGLYSDDPEILEELLGEHLKKIEAYQP